MGGTRYCKIIVIDSDKQPASDLYVQSVFEYIEKVRPIGALVTVASASIKNINITAKVSLANGYTIQVIRDIFQNVLEEYRKEIAFKDSYVSYAAIGNLLFRTEGIIDYSELKLNGAMANIPLANEEIPIINTIELEVM